METVYVLAWSCYDDWNIIGVFSSEEKAQNIIDSRPKSERNEYGIYEFDLDEVIK